MCPTDSPTIRRPPSLHGVLVGSVPPLQRYCEGATTSRCPSRLASFPSLGDTIYCLRPWSSLPVGFRTPLPMGRGFLLFSGDPSPASEGMETTRSPKFLGDPPSYLPCSSTPAGPQRQATSTFRCCPCIVNCEDSRIAAIEAQSHGFYDRCLRFTAMVTHGHARLASGCWPGLTGLDWLPTGSR